MTETAYETLGKAWPSNHVTQGKTVTRLYITNVFNVAALCPRCIIFLNICCRTIFQYCRFVIVISQVPAAAIQNDYTDSSLVILLLHILVL